MPLKSIEFVVKGHVQNVGFRYYLEGAAKAEGVVGWVKNDESGDVIGMAQGEESAVEKLKKLMAVGPRGAKVTNVEVKSESAIDRPQFSSFDIVRK